jgi:hypothetical protein
LFWFRCLLVAGTMGEQVRRGPQLQTNSMRSLASPKGDPKRPSATLVIWSGSLHCTGSQCTRVRSSTRRPRRTHAKHVSSLVHPCTWLPCLLKLSNRGCACVRGGGVLWGGRRLFLHDVNMDLGLFGRTRINEPLIVLSLLQ